MHLFVKFGWFKFPAPEFKMTTSNLIRQILLIFISILLSSSLLEAHDYYVTGRVTDPDGNLIQNARVSMIAGTREFAARTSTDGTYSIRISNIYDLVTGSIEVGLPYPNPFTYSVNIPFIINSSGDVRLSIYNFSGQKVMEAFFDSVDAGSYHITWDGCNQNGVQQRNGFYFYAITFRGTTKSGKLVKAQGFSSYSAGLSLAPDMMPPIEQPSPGQFSLPVVTSVSCDNYYPLRFTDISIRKDTTIDFELTIKQLMPFRTTTDHIAMHTGSEYRSLILKGINLGSSPPGYFPGEIAYAISATQYEQWIRTIAEAGFNSIRVYTLHPPVFYEKLAEYNQRNPENPLLLFQGIWLEEVEDPRNPVSYDLMNRSTSFSKEIREVIDCMNGNGDIPFRYGKSYGRYLTDVSRWIAGYILGREISPQEVDSTNIRHPDISTYAGKYLGISGGTASEVFVTQNLDLTLDYESMTYSVNRPVSISSWPTLDPLTHPTEYYTDEDKATYDITRIAPVKPGPGIFATYHAYPYYPNFISEDPGYMTYSDPEGRNSYLGYLADLKDHYSGIPVVIAEFGVPSSWGSAHQSYSNMNHGGNSEQQQGEKDMRLMRNILDAGCAGGFMFSWMDEWFKPTWIVSYLEAYGIVSEGATVPTRQLWHNLASPEQNFGLLRFEESSVEPFVSYTTDKPSGPVKKLSATNDNSCFYLEIESLNQLQEGDTVMIAFDSYLASLGESQLPNGKLLRNRSEFLLTMILSQDTALYHVTEAYDMNGLTPRFDLANHAVQRFRSTISDGAPWIVMQWINDGHTLARQNIGRLPVENSTDFTSGSRSAAAWSGNKIKVRIPWTLLYFRDPTQSEIIDGAVSYDGGYNYEITTATSDGIAVSVYLDGSVTSSLGRYTWPNRLLIPPTISREKKSLQVVKAGLSGIPRFTD
ncbi:MAG: T9SS type A sorting domain-containing protein [Bacteroidales bacterium]